MTIKIIIDGEGAVLGRVASYAAKQSLLGKSVVIVNCDKLLILGRKIGIINEYKESRARGGAARKGPHFPKEPFRLVKRTIRGMLDYKKGRGIEALKRIICYNDTPKEYESAEKIKLIKPLKIKPITVKELSERI